MNATNNVITVITVDDVSEMSMREFSHGLYVVKGVITLSDKTKSVNIPIDIYRFYEVYQAKA
jgi:hypothetical protein